MSYRVVIPTAGIGARLEKLTKHVNKSLVAISNRPILSHLIDQFPNSCEFVIGLGYKGKLVKEFLELAYPDRTFYFVNIDHFQGNGSGLGHSLLCCEQYLQEPFIFISCDTLVKEPIPNPKYNWMGFSNVKDLSAYRTLVVKDQNITQIHEKRKSNSKNEKAYIGLAGVKDYKLFWSAMNEGNQYVVDQGEAYAFKKILSQKLIKSHEFNWFDTGSPQTLAITREVYKELDEPNILEKDNEAIWFVNKRVIKFSTDSKFIENRFQRSKELKNFVPEVLDLKKNMYCYKKVKGQVFSNIINLPLFNDFLVFCEKFWIKKKLKLKDRKIFESKCHQFYYKKTRERIKQFYKNFKKQDNTENINGVKMPKLSSLLNRVDWKNLAKGCPGQFHGDFHFENILWDSNKERFIFLDWRQDFEGSLQVGDIYYDLAKLLHGMIVSHKIIQKNNFFVQWKGNQILFDLHRKQSLIEAENKFNDWCIEKGYSLTKVKTLTALIFLNIAALHHNPYSLFLYALGKDMLKKELDKI